EVEVALGHLAHRLCHAGNDAADDNAADVAVEREPNLVQQPLEDQCHLVGRLIAARGQPPVLQELRTLEHADDGLRVPDIDCEQHQPASISRERSIAGAEWVSAPTLIESTPVSATAATVPRLTPPDASLRRPCSRTNATAFRRVS